MDSPEAVNTGAAGHGQPRVPAAERQGDDDGGLPTPAPRSDRQVEQLLALNKAAVAITGELELDSLLQRIVDTARELIGCRYAALGVLGGDGYIVRFPTSGISKTERDKIGAPPRGHGLLGVMLRAGRTLRIPDIGKDPRRSGFPPNHPPMTSLLGVPIFVLGKLVGDLYLSDKLALSVAEGMGGPDFSEEDEWLVQLLASHAATALTNAGLNAENVRALESARWERARSDALLKVSQAINRSVRLDEVIELILESTVELLGAAGAAVYLPEQSKGNDEDRRFVARYAVGLEQSLTLERAQLPVEGSLAGRTLKSGATQVIEDTAEEPDIVFPKLEGKKLRSLVAVPLVHAGETTDDRRPTMDDGRPTNDPQFAIQGVLSAYSDRTHAFDQEAVRLLEAFGTAASTAMHNASLYEEAEKGREAAEREQERLRELEQMKDEFLSTAAHELRTPLTTIRMSAGLAREQVDRLVALDEIDPRIADLIGLIVEGGERMQSLVNDLLDLTRLEQGRVPLNVEMLDLREVVSASVDVVEPLFESRHQKLDVRLPEFRCSVRGDRQRLEQVIINLLSNANKYSPPNTEVEIRALRSGRECMVTVRDTGPGVPPDEREKIFERFYRSSMHRNDRTPSTGLGLPIARKIAEMHSGRVWVEGAPGGGSIFTLVLPAV